MFDMNSTAALPSEGAINDELFQELASEPAQGAWPVGWYKGQIIEGYATRKGTQFRTEDSVSKDGQSRNLFLCVAATNAKGETRNIQTLFNYRAFDFTAERMQAVKEAREEFKGVKTWPGAAKDLQRSSLAIAALGQLRKAVGSVFELTDVGVSPLPFIGKPVDVRLGHKPNDKGVVYNEITDFAASGTGAK